MIQLLNKSKSMDISIVVPVYKVEKYIHRCIKSILNQSYSSFNLVIVDDGSPDNCGKICDEYAKKDTRIHVIHKSNGGLSDARNAGIDWAIKNSDSKWITFIDSDDWVHPQYLEKMISSAEETNCNVCIVRYKKTNVPENYIVSKNNYRVFDTQQFYCCNTANATVAWGKLFKKSKFETIRFPVGRLHEDEYTTYKILFNYKKIVYIDEPLYYYFINSNSIMGSRWTPRRLDLLEAIEQNLVFFSEHNFFQAYLNRLEMMKKSICVYMDEINKSSNDEYKKRYYPLLRKKLRKNIKVCKKHSLYCFSNDKWAFGLAHPILMKEYWVLIAIKNKFGKKK